MLVVQLDELRILTIYDQNDICTVTNDNVRYVTTISTEVYLHRFWDLR